MTTCWEPGILRINIFQMLIGTAPVIIVLAPCVCPLNHMMYYNGIV